MAYNLQPLITILEQILNPKQTRWIVDHNKPQLQSLLQRSVSLQQILENPALSNIEILESEIRDAAHKAEDIIESHMLDQILPSLGDVILDYYKPQPQPKPKSLLKRRPNLRPLINILKQICNPKAEDMIESNPKGVSFTFSKRDLQKVTQELDSVMEQVVKLIEEKTMPTGSLSSGVSFLHDLSSKSIVREDSMQSQGVVGLDGDLMQLTDRVMGMQSKLEIIPIIGMGGIGKTTLARQLYQDPAIVEHFTYLAWTTVSQDYNMQAILLSFLRCIIGKESDEHAEKGSDELKDILYRSLYGRRYMIVLDDIWSIKFWDEIRMYLPDSNKGSRILITTRESEVAKHVSSQSMQHQMQLLSESASWDLLRQIVFGEEGCPIFLQGLGEKIARDCGGLPLAISVIGGILSKVERSKDGWKNIANNVAAAIAESDQQFSNILSLTYNHLPNHLKPCFLYVGVFPEDYDIKASRLVHIWVGEGFVKSIGNKSVEEVAEDWLKDLVERNLFLVREYRYGKPRLFGMHDLLRDLCIKKANEEQFVYVKNGPGATSSKPRRVCVHASSHGLHEDDNASAESMSLARSFILMGPTYDELPSCALSALRLVRVLDLMDVMTLKYFPKELFDLVNLRFLALYEYSKYYRAILRLRNLRTFITASGIACPLPHEIFEMSELRHLDLSFYICTEEEEDMEKVVPNKLQTISMIRLTDWLIMSGFLESIPEIENLGIRCPNHFTPDAVDLRHLHKLKTLRLHFYKWHRLSVSAFRFPRDLKNLVLDEAVIVPSDMMTLSALLNLEVLEIMDCDFESDEWEVAEGVKFCSLQVLHLSSLFNLVRWRADESNFPRLRYLCLKDCNALEEIPRGIGEIPTLQSIELVNCRSSAEASARQIVEEQQADYGNDNLKLHIISTSNYSQMLELKLVDYWSNVGSGS